MTIARKRLTIFILISIFIVVACFSFLAFTKKAYGDTADYELYYEYWSEGTDTGITEDTEEFYTDSGPVDYTEPTGEHYIGNYTTSWDYEGYVADKSFSYYSEYYEEGIIENAKEENYGYFEFSDSGHEIETYDDEFREYDWELEGYYEQSYPAPEVVRHNDMTCYQVNITEEGKFELIFWYEYENNNWITIYDKDGNLVYRYDFPHGSPSVTVDLPDGTYTVKTFHEEGKILQEFLIGKP